MNMKIGHHSGNILQTNHGRKSIELDIQDSEGREVFKRLVKDYDIVLEGFRPGLMAKYGLDYENLKAVNPKLIYCSISTYGQTGPYSKRPGFDLIAQAESGIINSTGDPDGAPQRIGTYLGDYVGAQSVLSAICAALYHREVTGEGQYLDVSLYESLAYLSANVDVYSLFGLKNGRTGNHMFNSAPYGLFEGAGKRYIAICAPTPPIWKNLCIAMQREDLLENERYSDMSKRIENRYELVDIIQAWLSKYENASEAIEILRSHDVPCAEVKADWEMHECPQLASRHYFEDIPFPKSIVEETGRKQYKIKGLPFKTSSDAENPDYLPLPEVGEHMLLSIPPKYSVSQVMGYLKGKSSLMIFDRHANLKYKYGNRHFWARGYYVDTVGRNKKQIQEYIRNQLQEDQIADQISIKEFVDPFTGSVNKKA